MAGRIAYTGGIVRDGLVLYLDAAKKDSYPGSGTTWTDLSGNRNNSTLTNGPTYDSGNDGSISFDGTNDYVNVTAASNINLGDNTGFTVEAWVYNAGPVGEPVWRGVMSKAGGGWIGIWKAGYGSLWHFRVVFDAADTSYEISTNTWYHLCLTRVGNTATGYVNSSADVSFSIGTNNNTTEDLTIGAYVPTSQYFIGKIPVFRLYNRGLTSTEIAQNFNALRGRYGL